MGPETLEFIGIFVAYVGTLGLVPGAEFKEVSLLTGTVAILGYAVTHIPDSIWKGVDWGTTTKFIFDGLVYGVVTAVTFAWLWPSAA